MAQFTAKGRAVIDPAGYILVIAPYAGESWSVGNDCESAEKRAQFIADSLNAINVLRLARKESTQAFTRASYGQQVQPVFDILDAKEAQ